MSPVIATILLIAIAVAASVTVFAYTQGMIGGVTQAKLVMSNAQRISTSTISFTVQNTGGTTTTISQVDLEEGSSGTPNQGVTTVKDALTNEIYDTNGDGGTSSNIVVAPGTSIILAVTVTGTPWSKGDTCSVYLWVDGSGSEGTASIDYSATFILPN